MNENLPQVIQEGFFTKIKNWFYRFFRKQKSVDYSVQEKMDEINKEIFIQDIKIESKDSILMLQRKIKEKQLEISDLTDQELDEMIELYKNQIEDKKARLKQYRVKIKNINAT